MKITAEACGESKSPEKKGKNHGNNAHEIGLRLPRELAAGAHRLSDLRRAEGCSVLLAHPVGNGPVHRDNLSLVSLLPVSVSGKVICHDG